MRHETTEQTVSPLLAEAVEEGTDLPPISGRDMHRAVTDRIIAVLEQGRIPWVRPFPGYGKSAQHGNPITKSTYSGINLLLCWLAAEVNGWTSTRWVTLRWLFDEGRKKGVTLRKLPDAPEGKTGQKATTIVYYGSTSQEIEDDEGNADTIERRFLKAYRVFNIDQLDGVPDDWIDTLPEQPDLERQRDEVDDWIDRTGARIHYEGNVGCYRFGTDDIRVPSFVKFLRGAHTHQEALSAFNGVRFHELIHWTGAADRLHRLDGVAFDKKLYAKEELIAEMGAAFLSARFGYETVLSHASYLGTWLDLLRGDKRLIVHAASAASKAVAYLEDLQSKGWPCRISR